MAGSVPSALAEVIASLPAAEREQLEARYGEFVRTTGREGADAFLDYLHSQQLIGTDTFCRAHLQREIEISALPGVSRVFDALGDDHRVRRPDDSAGQTDDGPGDRYESLGLVGEGAMGRVLLARDKVLRRKVAYKLLHQRALGNPRTAWRFLTEAQITAQLDHPNVIPLYALEQTRQASLAYAMKLIQGQTLKEVVAAHRDKPVGAAKARERLAERLEIFLRVCDGVEYAHSRGVIHRDLKPANVMIGPFNEVYVMDWGIAKAIGRTTALDDLVSTDGDAESGDSPVMTQIGDVVGTPAYMSPEQASGETTALRDTSDQFSLGVILFELATLQRAFDGPSSTAVLLKVMTADVAPLKHAHGHAIPRELAAICRKALAQQPEARYRSVGALTDDLRAFLRGDAVRACPDNFVQKRMRWLSQHRYATAMILLATLGLGVAFTLYFEFQHREARERLRHKAVERAQIQANHRQQLRLQVEKRKEEGRLAAFLAAASKQAHRLDTSMHEMEALLEGVSVATHYALKHGAPGTDALHRSASFTRRAPGGPADLKPSRHYRGLVSLAWPVVSTAPGADLTKAERILRRLVALRSLLKRTLQRGAVDTMLSEAQIRDKGAPIAWIFWGLADGSHMLYPGKGGIAASYDARTRPWFRHALGRRGRHWGNLYVDSFGAGLVLPCTEALYDPAGKLLGVVGLELHFSYLLARLQPSTAIARSTHVYLVDRQGTILARRGDLKRHHQERGKHRGAGRLHQGFKGKLLPHPALVAAIRQRGSGYLDLGTTKPGLKAAFFPLTAQDWYYVVLSQF